VISAWFFSLYINDLISELKAVNSGISISDLNIPAILLADACRKNHTFPNHGVRNRRHTLGLDHNVVKRV
jgi:hypothetical protein